MSITLVIAGVVVGLETAVWLDDPAFSGDQGS